MFSDTDSTCERRGIDAVTDRAVDRGAEASDRRRSARWPRVRRGIEGGALATVVMTAYRLPVKRTLPPSAEFWTKFVSGGDPEDHPVAALVLHLVYGVTAGGVFAAMLPARESVPEESGGRGPPSPSGEVVTTLLGLVYGVVLSVFGEYVVLRRVLDVEPDDRFVFHVGHVLYGITLGSWVGTRTRDAGE